MGKLFGMVTTAILNRLDLNLNFNGTHISINPHKQEQSIYFCKGSCFYQIGITSVAIYVCTKNQEVDLSLFLLVVIRLVSDATVNKGTTYLNLCKSRQCWGLISKVLMNVVSTVRACGMLYKSFSEALLIYGNKSWVVTVYMLKLLEGFHHREDPLISIIRA